MTERLAKFLSILLGPHLWLPVLFVSFLLKSDLNRDSLFILFPSVIFLQVILPLGYLFTARRLGWSSAWDLKTRSERSPLLLITLLSCLLTIVLAYFWGNPMSFHLSLILVVLAVFFFIINKFWQISLHAGLNTSATIFLNFLFDWQAPYLYIAIPIIYWSRLYLRKHTPAQLVIGSLVSLTIIIGGLRALSYI